MTDANGHAAGELLAIAPESATAAELDGVMHGLFEPVQFEVAPGRYFELRPLRLNRADELYGGGLSGAALQKFLLARCVYINGKPIGAELADTFPIGLAHRVVAAIERVNAMDWKPPGGEGEASSDPKA